MLFGILGPKDKVTTRPRTLTAATIPRTAGMPNLPFKIGRTKTPKVAPIFATPAAKPHPVATSAVAVGLLRPMLVLLATARFLVVRCLMMLASNFRQIHGRLWKLHIHFFHRAGNDLRNRQIAEPLVVRRNDEP